MAISNFCLSRESRISFSEAMKTAANTFALAVAKKHNGLIEEIPNETLTQDQIYQGAYLQILEGAIQLCPNSVPSTEKQKFKAALKQLQKSKK